MRWSKIWFDVMWCDLAWCDVMWRDVMRCDVMWCDVICRSFMWHDASDVMWSGRQCRPLHRCPLRSWRRTQGVLRLASPTSTPLNAASPRFNSLTQLISSNRRSRMQKRDRRSMCAPWMWGTWRSRLSWSTWPTRPVFLSFYAQQPYLGLTRDKALIRPSLSLAHEARLFRVLTKPPLRWVQRLVLESV